MSVLLDSIERRPLPGGSGLDHLPRELEDPERAALRDAGVLLRHLAAPERDRAPPAVHHRDVLLTVGLPGDGRADDSRAGLELPELLAGPGVERLEIAFGRPGEDQPAPGGENAAPEHAGI